MQARFTQRWFLVAIIATAQLTCLLIGQTWFVGRLETELRNNRQQAALSQNQAIVNGIAAYISALPPEVDQIDHREITRLTQWAGVIHRPEFCTIRLVNRAGEVIAQPGFDEWLPSSESQVIEPLVLLDGRRIRIEQLPEADLSYAQGALLRHDGLHWTAAQYVPRFDITVVAERPEAAIGRDIEMVIAAIDVAGVWIAIFISIMSFLMVTMIVQRYEHRLQAVNAGLTDTIARRERDLLSTRDAVVFGLAKLAESRDDDTGQHLERIRHYVRLLAEELVRDYPDLTPDAIELMCVTSSLHDIGKVGIPDAVLLKPGKLTAEERAIIQKHPLIGGDCLMAIRQRLGNDSFLDVACEIAFAHHERWDGGGYPFGLKGDQIPLAARVVSLADVYDALTMQRAYKAAMPHDVARKIIIEGNGTQFDPRVVDAFVRAEHKFRLCAEHHNARTAGQLETDPDHRMATAGAATNS